MDPAEPKAVFLSYASQDAAAKIASEDLDAWAHARAAGIFCAAREYAAALGEARLMDFPVITTQIGVRIRDLEIARIHGLPMTSAENATGM